MAVVVEACATASRPRSVVARPAITKTAIRGAQSCERRAWLSFVKGEKDIYSPQSAASPLLVSLRARHYAAAAWHRIVQRGGTVDPAALEALWAQAWQRAGGGKVDDSGGLDWLEHYVRTNPFSLGITRRILAVESTLTATCLGRTWQCRPDLLVECDDGSVEALELTSSRAPCIDRSAVETMAAIDQLCLRLHLPEQYQGRAQRVAFAHLDTYQILDVTLPDIEVRRVLTRIAAWLRGLDALETAQASPAPEICGRCPYRDSCPDTWPVPTARASIDQSLESLFGGEVVRS